MIYRKIEGFKYQLLSSFSTVVPLTLAPRETVQSPKNGPAMITLDTEGILQISKGYLWDGASGPTWDDNTNMVPALVHDALYQLMRCKAIPLAHRRTVDRHFHFMLRNRGMNKFRAWKWYWGVRMFGKSSAKPQKSEKYVAHKAD